VFIVVKRNRIGECVAMGEVMLYPQAYRDIDEIYAYIALEKQAPENAQGQTDRIWDAIDSLAVFKIDEDAKIVYVVTVQYQGRDI